MIKWPKKVKHRNKVLAKIYRPCSGRDSYRVAWHAAGRRMMKSFRTYSGAGGAKEFAEAQVKELAKHSQAIMLTPGQAADALAAIERLLHVAGKRFIRPNDWNSFLETQHAKSVGTAPFKPGSEGTI